MDAPSGPDPPAELSIESALAYAVRLHQDDMLEGAMEIYRRILGADERHPDALHFLGVAHFQMGERDTAVDLIGRSLAINPRNASALNNLGNVWKTAGRKDEAAGAYRRVLELEPDHASARSNLGALLHQQGRDPEAETELRRALAADPSLAEAYFNLGVVLQDQSRDDEAIGVYHKALLYGSCEPEVYRRFGVLLSTIGKNDEAAALYRKWIEQEPDNEMPRHMLAGLTGAAAPARATDMVVRQTFDNFAERFDAVLRGHLKYQAPELVADAAMRTGAPPAAALDVLDAGAGTGLCGPLLRPFARRLVGIDLSQPMLEKAKDRGYDVLEAAELTAYMREHPRAFDLIVSADTLCYFGDLGPPVGAAAVALRPGGRLVFTVEHEPETEPKDGPGFRLHHHGRYSHAEAAVRAWLVDAGFQVVSIGNAHLRIEADRNVAGLVVVARLLPAVP